MKRRMSSSDGRRTRANEREEEEQVRSVSVAEGEERSIGLRKISIFERILSSCSLYSSASDRRMESSYFGNVERLASGVSNCLGETKGKKVKNGCEEREREKKEERHLRLREQLRPVSKMNEINHRLQVYG